MGTSSSGATNTAGTSGSGGSDNGGSAGAGGSSSGGSAGTPSGGTAGSSTTNGGTAGANGGGTAGMTGGGTTGAGGTTGSGGTTAAGGTTASGGAAGCGSLTTKKVTSTLVTPVYATAPAGDSRLFVLERTAGRVTILDGNGAKVSTFLDISKNISAAGFEAGILSLAFHPQFSQNGAFYVTYTTANTLRVSRFTVSSGDPNVADPASEALVIEAPQTSHHNTGGMLLFGPDGDLYVAIGDDDTQANGQDLKALNAKMLRLAVDPSKGGYTIPADNPFAGNASARPEIWAYGLREPYRFWFDEPSGNLYIADVGDAAHEEIDVVGAAKAGLNFGWPIMEGLSCHTPATGCTKTGLTMPVYDFPHSGPETAVIGGSVYRGTTLPTCYAGKYFFGTYNAGTIDTLALAGGTAQVAAAPDLNDPDVASFGQDGHGELLLIDNDQNVFRIVPK